MDTIDTTEPVGKKGLSRRQVIVGGAVGTAAFWSVPIIDSVTQRAAAQSGCQPVVLNSVSYVFVVYTFNNVTYFTGFNLGCNDQGANQGITQTVTCDSVTYSMTSGSVAVDIAPPQNSQSSATHLTASASTSYVTCNSDKVAPAQTGVDIVAYFWFTGGGNGGPGAACTSSGGTPICVSFD